MISTNDVRPGMTLDLEDGIFQIVEYQHVKPGKGKAFVRMKLKNVESGAVLDRTFRAEEPVQQAIIERRPHQFLYRDDMGFHFMDEETYAQLRLADPDVGDAAAYLREGDTVSLSMYEGKAIGLDLPTSVEMDVVETEPGIKGDRSSAGTKPATTDTGLVVQVPLFVEIGDRIKVDTRSGSYMTRVT
ncbi:MAG TPA: elongation factor P [Acidimicrobiia bacterium]|nr:elongation factor P [Acidimicrobiia bacterium]